MPSPISAEDFPILSLQADLCQRLGTLLKGYDNMREFFEWFLNDQDEISDEALGGILDRMSPVGMIVMWGAAVLPSDKWRVCNGQELDRTTYKALFDRYGTTFGNGNGTSTFNIPKMIDLFPVGAGGAYARGQTGGQASVKLEVPNLPKHAHVVNLDVFGGPGNSMSHDGIGSLAQGDKPPPGLLQPHTTDEIGGDVPHDNIPPYFGIGFIIKVA